MRALVYEGPRKVVVKEMPDARIQDPTDVRMRTGQAPVIAYNRYLCRLINEGRAKPSFIVSHQLSLDEAPEAYQHFDAREHGWTKVILKPQLQASLPH
jgi:hypothetical protein